MQGNAPSAFDILINPTASPGAGSPLSGIVSVLQQIALGQQQILTALNSIKSEIITNFPQWVPVPATAASPGVAGQTAYQSGFLYICVASNTWQRVAIATF